MSLNTPSNPAVLDTGEEDVPRRGRPGDSGVVRLRDLLDHQAGVVARRQLMATGVRPHDVRRLIRRRELVPLHPGVYVTHTGTPTWIQSAWAAVLACEPAALAGRSALVWGDGREVAAAGPIHLAIPWERQCLRELDGVRVARRRGFQRLALVGSPPRIPLEEAVIDLAEEARTDMAALEEIGRVVQARRTTAARLEATLAARSRVRRREWLGRVLADVGAGTCSVLEHGYLDHVERAHGLPRGRRQVRDRISRGIVYRDVDYDLGMVVELDGRLHHDTTRGRDRDFDRDLDAAVDARVTVRLSYGQVFDRPCWTAERLGRILTGLGWLGGPRRCPRCP
jgi:hypothetical protein